MELARDLKAKAIVDKFSSRSKEKMESNKNDKLRHRIHQWSVVKFVEMLKIQPIDVDEVSESYTSSTNPFDGEKLKKRKQVVEKVIKVLNPYLMTAHEGGGIKVFKVGIWRVVKLFWKGILLPLLTLQERWMGGYWRSVLNLLVKL